MQNQCFHAVFDTMLAFSLICAKQWDKLFKNRPRKAFGKQSFNNLEGNDLFKQLITYMFLNDVCQNCFVYSWVLCPNIACDQVKTELGSLWSANTSYLCFWYHLNVLSIFLLGLIVLYFIDKLYLQNGWPTMFSFIFGRHRHCRFSPLQISETPPADFAETEFRLSQ